MLLLPSFNYYVKVHYAATLSIHLEGREGKPHVTRQRLETDNQGLLHLQQCVATVTSKATNLRKGKHHLSKLKWFELHFFFSH